MQGFLSRLGARKTKSTGVLNVKPNGVDFLFFEKKQEGIRVIAYGEERTSNWDTQEALKKLLAEAAKQEKIERLVVTFPHDQFRALLVEETIAPAVSQHTIDQKEAYELERDIRARARRTFHRLLFRETGILPQDFSLQRITVLDWRIDGYRVPHLAGYKRGAIGCSVLGLFLLEPPFLAVEQAAQAGKIFRLHVSHIAEAIAAFAQAGQKNGVYLAVGEHHTQVAIWKDGEFRFPGVVAMGERRLLEALREGFGMQENTARELQRRYAQGALSADVQEKIRTVCLPEVQKFGTMLKEPLAKAGTSLPSDIWVLGRGGLLRGASSLFGEEQKQGLPFLDNPRLSLLLPRDVWEHAEFLESNNPLYTPLCVLGYEKETH